MGAKEELLKQAQEGFQAFKAAYAGLSEAQMRELMLGTWSIREVLCHVAGWHREMVPAFERISRGEKPLPEGISYDDVDGWNAKFVKAYAGKSVAEILREVEASHDALLAAAKQVPADRFAPGRSATRTLEAVGAHHYKEHGDQIHAWLASKGH